MRRGAFDEAELEAQLDNRGFLNRFFGRASRSMTEALAHVPARPAVRPRLRHGDRDRAAGDGRHRGGGRLPIYAILCLPILFAAGMSLLDTIDGALMYFAYGWAFSKPIRKIFYNITITALSVVVALVIGAISCSACSGEVLP